MTNQNAKLRTPDLDVVNELLVRVFKECDFQYVEPLASSVGIDYRQPHSEVALADVLLGEVAGSRPAPDTKGNAPERLSSPVAAAGCGSDPVTAVPTSVPEGKPYAWDVAPWSGEPSCILRDSEIHSHRRAEVKRTGLPLYTRPATPPAPREAVGEARELFCVWCFAHVPYTDGDADKQTAALGAMREHSATCPEHPAVKALAAVRAARQPEGEPVAWAVVGRDAGVMHTASSREEAEAFRIQLAPSWADGDSWRLVPIRYPALRPTETP